VPPAGGGQLVAGSKNSASRERSAQRDCAHEDLAVSREPRLARCKKKPRQRCFSGGAFWIPWVFARYRLAGRL